MTNTIKPTFPGGLILGEELGAGAYGTVYEAVDIIRGRVAVKVYQKLPDESGAQWQERLQSLLSEGQRLRLAEHDHVVHIFQALLSDDGSSVGLVMEHCANGSLEAAYKIGPIGFNSVRSLLTETALGLQAIHARGMIHRDIKPANILLGANRRAKIGDFGWVTSDLVLGYGAMGGYLDHLAPEVFRTRLMGVKTDVWAFGMTSYRLLNGHPFYTELPARPVYLVPEGGFAAKLLWLPHIPDKWRRFVRRAMHDDPNKRFQNAGELLDGLAGLPVEPEWACIYGQEQAAWQRRKGKQALYVKWDKPITGRHHWIATSINTETGKSRVLGEAKGDLNKKEAMAEMQAFFSNGGK